MSKNMTRRRFIQSTAAIAASVSVGAKQVNPLHRQVGITTSSLSGHLVARPTADKFTLMELPRIMRDELDLKVIDLNTSSFASSDPKYLESIRKAADDAGCMLTNLKMNQRGLNMNSPDKDVREKALREYRRSITAAHHLGLRWARPLPLADRPDMKIHVDSYLQLADYAAERNVEMLVENFGWMQSDPKSVVKLVRAIGRNVAACPDTGNWNNDEIRYAGLAATFPIAVSCDFKARELGPNGAHRKYDLKRCFEIGWRAGFRGPWCLEHANPDRAKLFRELSWLRDQLRGWMRTMNCTG